MKKRILPLAMVAVLLIACCSMLVACDGDGDGLSGTKWVLSGGEMSGITVTAEQLKASLGECVIEFKSGGKASLTLGDRADEGSYTLDGDTIVLTDSTGLEQIITREGNKMTMKQESGELVINMIFEKK